LTELIFYYSHVQVYWLVCGEEADADVQCNSASEVPRNYTLIELLQVYARTRVWLAGISSGHCIASSHLFWVTDAGGNEQTNTAVCGPHEWPTSADPPWPR